MARPKKEIKMIHKLTVRYTDEGMANVKKNAETYGIGVTDYVRRETDKLKSIKPRLSKEEVLILKEMISAYNNLNQIARHFNKGDHPLEDLHEVLSFFKSQIGKLR